jgi:hypothetical protein
MMVATIACQSVGMLIAAAITLLLLKGGSTQAWRLFLATEGAVALLFFCFTPVGTRKSALVDVSRWICKGGGSFHSDHSRATRGSAAAYL